MSNPPEDLTTLLQQLQEDKISPEQFQLKSAGLINEIGKVASPARKDPVRIDEIDAAAYKLRNL